MKKGFKIAAWLLTSASVAAAAHYYDPLTVIKNAANQIFSPRIEVIYVPVFIRVPRYDEPNYSDMQLYTEVSLK
jgi:hypothetical protein